MSERNSAVHHVDVQDPHIVETVRMLDNILKRMQAHQTKKRALLRSLKLADRLSPAERSNDKHSSAQGF